MCVFVHINFVHININQAINSLERNVLPTSKVPLTASIYHLYLDLLPVALDMMD